MSASNRSPRNFAACSAPICASWRRNIRRSPILPGNLGSTVRSSTATFGRKLPRADVLARICRFFEIDARVLLEPVTEISLNQDPINNSFLRDFLGTGVQNVPEADFPSGFYRFARRSFLDHDRFVTGVVYIKRDGSSTFLRGYESAHSRASKGCPPAPRRANIAASSRSKRMAFPSSYRGVVH